MPPLPSEYLSKNSALSVDACRYRASIFFTMGSAGEKARCEASGVVAVEQQAELHATVHAKPRTQASPRGLARETSSRLA